MIFRARVENLPAILRVLEEVADGVEPALSAGIRSALEPVLDSARRTTPVETGALRASTRIAVSAGRGQGRGTVGWTRRGGVRGAQMIAVEYGGRGRRGRRTLFRAFDVDQAERDFADSMRAGIDAALRRGVARSGGRLRLTR